MSRNRQGMRGTVVMCAVALVFVVMCGANSPLAAQQQPPAAGVTPPMSAAEALLKGMADGDSAATTVSPFGWALRKILTRGSMFYGNDSDVNLPLELRLRILNESPVYQQAYQEAYGKRLTARRHATALQLGVLGVLVAIVVGAVVFADG